MILHARTISRLCRRNLPKNQRYQHAQASSEAEKSDKRKDFKSLYEKHKDKIEFNSGLDHEKLKLGYFKYYIKSIKNAKETVRKDNEQKLLTPLPVSLKYFVDKEQLLNNDKLVEPELIQEKPFQLPLGTPTPVPTQSTPPNKEQTEFNNNTDKWMTNYEQFDDTSLEEDEEDGDTSWNRQYGTPDPESEVSSTPCGGCGALLHCSDPAIPGYLPSEILKNSEANELPHIECQRCHFLKEYNIALDVNVQPEEYERLLQSIRSIKSLVVLMVDLLDFPCSIWPGIVDIIGTKRPIIIVGNKVDLIPGDSIGYLKRIRESLRAEINKTALGQANIKHIALISAKSGYGVENLISAMFKTWLAKGDVFLVGTTNVGKSSLFNALLQSDYCKVHAVDIVKRATVSRWPGTTLNLLKFPINRPSGWKIYHRNQRLKADSRLMKVEKQIRKSQIEGTASQDMPQLIGHIGRTFSDPRSFEDVFHKGSSTNRLFLNEKDKEFVNSKWLYDTPGVIHPDQVLSLLTTEELLLTVPKKLIQPQTYYLRAGSTIFIGGLARIDFLESQAPCRFTIFCSDGLPITITKTEHADELYNEFIGTEMFGAPIGSAERLQNWPGLKKHSNVLEFKGEGPHLCCGDVVLSSVGWVSVTAKPDDVCKLEAWTPEARGIHTRYPSLLPKAITLKGKRLRDTPAYRLGKVFIDDDYIESLKEE